MGEKNLLTAGSNIAEVLEKGPVVEDLFKELGLKCVDCVAAEKETLQDAARLHEMPLEKILSALNKQSS